MTDRVDAIRTRFEEEADAVRDGAALQELRNRMLSRKTGAVTLLLREMGSVPPEERPAFGQQVNRLKNLVEERLREIESRLEGGRREVELSRPRIDVTLPGRDPGAGGRHPVARVRAEIETIFREMGYEVEDGPEIEDEYHNFEALNMPADHPARDTQDTFFLEGGRLLRTHTSPVQIRSMERRRPPIRVIAPGRVYRRDSDLTHSPMFHQVEGLLVDEGITFAHLKGTLETFFQTLFDPDVRIRLRPSFFPFTEPSAETDLSCFFCRQQGCAVCKRSGWLEMGGSGMVDPEVFRFVSIDPERYTGFAFGFGIDRIAMLKYGIDNINHLFDGDLRFLRQF